MTRLLNARIRGTVAALAFVLIYPQLNAQDVKRTTNLYSAGPCDGDKAAEGKDLSDPVDLSLGDYQLTQTDLFIPGRGLDFAFTRTYRSRTGLWSLFRGWQVAHEHLGETVYLPPSPMGTNWDHSYNMSVALSTDTSGTANEIIEFFKGDGTCYIYGYHQGEEIEPGVNVDTFRRYEFHGIFKRGDQDGAAGSEYGPESVEYITPDLTIYRFVDLDDNDTEIRGKIRSITDRNGNTIEFSYDLENTTKYPNTADHLGRLDTVTDTLGREIELFYDTTHKHLLKRIKDFADREVEYAYDTYTIDRVDDPAPPNPPKTDFVKHNLTSVKLPEIEDNAYFDLPIEHTTTDGTTPLPRREWVYEYEDELDLAAMEAEDWWEDVWVAGGLVSVTDPNGSEIVHNEYLPPLENENDIRDYRLIAQEYGGERYDYLVEIIPDGQISWTHGGEKFNVWVSNRAGHVKKLEYSAQRRLIRRTDYSGDPPAGERHTTNTSHYASAQQSALPLPGGSVRASDPDKWVTDFSDGQGGGGLGYNDDWHVTRKELPNGDVITYEFDDGGQDGDYRLRGNVLSRTRTPDSETGGITEEWTYEENFGGCCGTSFPKTYTDGENRTTTHQYDTAGNRTKTTYPMITQGESNQTIEEEWTYNSHGQVTAHKHPAAGSPLTSNGTYRQEDDFSYYTGSESGREHMKGYLKEKTVSAQAGGLSLTTTYEYDAVGNVTKITEPHGDEATPTVKVTLFLYNQHNELVRETVLYEQRDTLVDQGQTSEYGYETHHYYDQNGNRVRTDRPNRTETTTAGVWADASNAALTTIHEYDDLNFRTATYVEAEAVDVALSVRDGSSLDLSKFLVTRLQYDANKNLRLIEKGEATAGNQADNTIVYEYDERDMLYREHIGATYDIDANGVIELGVDDEWANTQLLLVEHDYDENGNLERRAIIPDSGPARETTYGYDGHDRPISETDPDGDETEYEYDDAHNTILVAHYEGSIDSGTKLSEAKYLYDELNRQIETQRLWINDIDANNNVTHGDRERRRYHPNSALRRVEYLAHIDHGTYEWNIFNFTYVGTDYSYDEASRLEKVTDTLGNETEYTYDAASNVLTSTEREWSESLSRIEQTFTTTYTYDDRDRLETDTDSEGNAAQYSYDSRNNQIGLVDARGNATAYIYDPADRLVTTVRDMDGDGADGGAPGGSEPDIVTVQAWDTSSRLIGQQDDKGNWISYAYDGADRKIATRMADGTIHQVGSGLLASAWTSPPDPPSLSAFTSGYDSYGDAVTSEDANGTVVASTYDAKGRLTDRTITPASGNPHNVQGTTWEEYQYDGLDRVVMARDDDVTIVREYDELSRVVAERYYVDSTSAQDTSKAAFVADTDNTAIEVAFEYSFNRAGQVYKADYPGGRSVRRDYDDLNRVVTVYDDGDDPSAGEFIATYDYIGSYRVETRTYGNDTRTTYAYNGRTSVNDGAGSFTSAPNASGDFGAGQVSGITHTFLDSGGSPPSPTDLDDRSFLWDENQNKISRVEVAGTYPRRFDYAYDRANRMVSSEFYVPGLTPPTTPQYQYTLDGVHNRQSVDDSVTADDSGPYYMLADNPPGDEQVNQYSLTPRHHQTYDPNGNLILMQPLCDADLDLNGTVDVFDFNIFIANWGQCDSSWTWLDGNLDGDPNGCVDVFDFNVYGPAFGNNCYADEIAYDYRNQMVEYVDNIGEDPGELTHEYRYDCFGRRIGKSLDTANETSESRFYYGGEALWQLCEVRSYPDAGTDPEDFDVQGTFVHGPQYIDEVIQYIPGFIAPINPPPPSEIYYHQDDLFNVMALSREDGSVYERFDYGDYGAPMDDSMGQLTSTYPVVAFLFNGRFYDEEIRGNDGTGLGWYQYRTRSMDPVAGRFVTGDSLGAWGDRLNGGNRYAYTGSSPWHLGDPFGLDSEKEKSKAKKRKGVPGGDYHKRNGAYYEYTIVCTDLCGNKTTKKKRGWTFDISGLMRDVSGSGCCIKRFQLSTHHSGGYVYADPSKNKCEDAIFANSFNLCDGANVDLNMCNSCDIAKRIRDRHPGFGAKIECTEKENRHLPIDWWIWPAPGIDLPRGGDDKKFKSHGRASRPSMGASVGAACVSCAQ